MTEVKIQLTGDADLTRAVINDIQTVQGVQRAEEVADLMQRRADPDSSSAGLPDDVGPGSHALVVETSGDEVADRVRERIRTLAGQRGAAVEFVEHF